jgi:hypothetical protein
MAFVRDYLYLFDLISFPVGEFEVILKLPLGALTWLNIPEKFFQYPSVAVASSKALTTSFELSFKT